MRFNIPVTIKANPLPELIAFLRQHGLEKLSLVADDNTYAALGRRVAETLEGQEFDLKTIVLSGEEVVPDERFIMQVLVPAGNEKRTYLAVGSGVVTDIVRFVSHRTRTGFISLPTAPSVDGYTSVSASLVLGRLKQTIYAQPPLAVFADLDTLCAAPRPMIAAGFGDVLAKYTSVADWRLGHLFWGVAWDEAIAQRARTARDRCVQQVEEIARSSPEGVRSVIEALVETGLCMLEFGGSYPAGGSEHYVSHVWEMKLLQEGKPAILHGAKVGVATILVAGFYAQIRQLSQEQAAVRLRQARLPDRQREIERIRGFYDPLGLTDRIIAEQAPFLDMSEAEYEQLKQRILDLWPEVQRVAAGVPTPQALTDWLRQVGGPTTAGELGFSEEEQEFALHASHYLRNRFTGVKLSRILGLLP